VSLRSHSVGKHEYYVCTRLQPHSFAGGGCLTTLLYLLLKRIYFQEVDVRFMLLWNYTTFIVGAGLFFSISSAAVISVLAAF
jgi:hypothetical protein